MLCKTNRIALRMMLVSVLRLFFTFPVCLLQPNESEVDGTLWMIFRDAIQLPQLIKDKEGHIKTR